MRAIPFLITALVLVGPAAADLVPRFNRDVRPILSANCLTCHGPDAKQRKAGLRLDDKDSALAKGAVVPGDPQASKMLQRILTSDPDEHMPPASTELTLSPRDIDVLTRWIAAGAEYEPHWSMVPVPDSVPLPVLDDPERWSRSAIDAFVLEKLNAEGLKPSPAADKETLLRRVSLDLTGLPPTVAEQDAFLADTSPAAYEHAVDRLLASPAFGERMAVDWMDAARYADTFGYQADVEMNVWPWRDWVIKAFNANLPYDKFITWQVAGDLLPNATQEQRLATTFNRLHRQTNEGGSIPEEFRCSYVADRTETFGTAFLGLTMVCSKCHDHKFDPISQKDFYSLSSFFANIDESGLYAHFVHPAPTPALPLYKEGEEAKHAELKNAIAEAEKASVLADASARTRLDDWLKDTAKIIEDPKPVAYWPLDTIENGATPDLAVPDNKASVVMSPQAVAGVKGQALEFNGDNGIESGKPADFERWQPFTVSLWVKQDAIAPKACLLHHTKAETDAGSRGWELLLNEGKPQFSLIHFWPGNAIRVIAKHPMPVGQWVHLAARYDGSSRAAGLEIFLDGEPVETEVVRDHLYKKIQYDSPGTAALTLAERFRDSGFKGMVDEVRVYDSALAQLDLDALARLRTTPEQFASVSAQATDTARAMITDFFTRRVDAPALEARTKLSDARRTESAFIETIPNIMTMEELPTPKETHILARGQYDHPGDAVSMDTPHALPPFPKDAPHNRLGLARWLCDSKHPLTSRVAVNRYWQIFFGRGLVETQEDFGVQGKPPTHPELLDYLARSFMDSGWDLKGLCRAIVLSNTYQQSSGTTPELRTRDPYNALLARGPRFRLSAEQIRDSALADSGLLNTTIGGPSVFPYQPGGLWEDAASTSYPTSKGADLYRRGLYTFVKRTVPPPSTLTFDAGTRETCIVRRERTTTPLQALVLLNDPQYVEAARVLAEGLVASMPDDTARVVQIFRGLTSRKPSAAEQEILSKTFADQKAYYAAHPEEAAKLALAGTAPRNEALDPVAVAATTAVAQAVMNLDDFQMRR